MQQNNKVIKINVSMVNDEKKLIVSGDFSEEKMKISFGKKKHFLFYKKFYWKKINKISPVFKNKKKSLNLMFFNY